MQRGFAAFPSPVLWLMALLFGVPALFDVVNELSLAPIDNAVFNLSELAVGLFMLYCAVQAYRGKRADLASRRTTMIGYACFAFFGLCFLVKIGVTAVAVGG